MKKTFPELLRELGIETRTEGAHTRAGWIQMDCPFCGTGARKYHLGYSAVGRYANCWKCGWHSELETLKALTGWRTTQARNALEELKRPESLNEVTPRPREIEVPPGVGPLLKNHRDYLRARRFDPDTVSRLWGVRGIGLAARLRWRLFLPIYSGGALVSWTTRATGDEARPRYISCPDAKEVIPHKRILYGADLARDSIVLVEGPTDAWRIGPGAVATFGTSLTAAQIVAASQYPRRVICFDNERTAQSVARRIEAALSTLPGETIRIEIDAKDPGELNDNEVTRIRRLFLGA